MTSFSLSVDSSGKALDLHPGYGGGPDVQSSRGSSAVLAEGTFMSSSPATIEPSSSSYWSISFWLFLSEFSGVKGLISLGDAMWLGAQSGGSSRFKIFMSDSTSSKCASPDSKTSAVLETELWTRKWYLLSFLTSESNTAIYVNGVKITDSSMTIKLSSPVEIAIGQIQQCPKSAEGFLDEVVVISATDLDTAIQWIEGMQIERLRSRTEPFVYMGSSIIQTQVVSSCSPPHRLCSLGEIEEMYHSLYALGFIAHNGTRVWHTKSSEDSDHTATGLLICCLADANSISTTTPAPEADCISF